MGKTTIMNLVVAMIALVLPSSQAREHMVGGLITWTIPPAGASSFASWTSNHSFSVGDTLVFNFVTGRDDVALVNKKDFDACNDTDPLSYETIGPAYFRIKSAGNYYFISTVANHCAAGQKLAIQVADSNNINISTNSLAPTPAVTPSIQPSLSHSECSASYFLTAFSLIFTSIAIAFLSHFY